MNFDVNPRILVCFLKPYAHINKRSYLIYSQQFYTLPSRSFKKTNLRVSFVSNFTRLCCS